MKPMNARGLSPGFAFRGCIAAISLLLLPFAPAAAIDKPVTPEPGICFVRVWAIAPLEPVSDGSSARWGVWLRTAPNVQSGLTTGTISLVGEDARYDVPVTDFATPSAPDEKSYPSGVPLVVRFPQPVKLELGYVASIGGADPGPCYHYSSFANVSPGGNVPKLWRALNDLARTATVVDAPPSVPDLPLPNCVDDGKKVLPKATSLVQPHSMSRITITGDLITLVRVDLTDEGVLASAAVFKSSGDDVWDSAAVLAANGTKYTGGRFHCRPAGGSYLFRADYNYKPHV